MRFNYTNRLAGMAGNVNSPIEFIWSSTVGPHALVTRLDYTVPAGRIARVSGFATKVMCLTLPSAVVNYGIDYAITKLGGSLQLVYIMNNTIASVGWGWLNNMVCDYWLAEGDLLEIRSHDTNTGGTANYNTSCAVAEYIL